MVIMETYAEWNHPYLTSSSLFHFTTKCSLPDQSFKSTNKLGRTGRTEKNNLDQGLINLNMLGTN